MLLSTSSFHPKPRWNAFGKFNHGLYISPFVSLPFYFFQPASSWVKSVTSSSRRVLICEDAGCHWHAGISATPYLKVYMRRRREDLLQETCDNILWKTSGQPAAAAFLHKRQTSSRWADDDTYVSGWIKLCSLITHVLQLKHPPLLTMDKKMVDFPHPPYLGQCGSHFLSLLSALCSSLSDGIVNMQLAVVYPWIYSVDLQ
jgi:hypothetical protein